ncbi:Histone deacetylase 6, partial [Geodia barretti]
MEDCLQGSEGSSGLGDRPFASKAHEPCSKPGLLYDARMREHENEGNPSHPESPDRISRIWSLLRERGLVERCCLVEAREATKEEILKIHSEEHYVTMETTREKSTEELREMARDYNSVYLHKLIFPCALLAAGSVIEMTEKVLQGKVGPALNMGQFQQESLIWRVRGLILYVQQTSPNVYTKPPFSSSCLL